MKRIRQMIGLFMALLLFCMPAISISAETTAPFLAGYDNDEGDQEDEDFYPELNLLQVQSTPDYEIWDGSIADSYAGGSGTMNDPYQIATAEQLAKVAADTATAVSSQKIYYSLMDDIYLNAVYDWKVWGEDHAPQNKWTPIGMNATHDFCGDFNGNGHKIYGLYIDSDEDYQGLFGSANSASSIKAVGVECSYVSGGDFVGGVIGYIHANNTAERIRDCHSGATVVGSRYVGGVVGRIGSDLQYRTPLKNCYNTGKVVGKTYVGGVMGQCTSGAVSDSYNVGPVIGEDQVGGVAGEAFEITSCWNRGSVEGNGRVGGVVGQMVASEGHAQTTVTKCFNVGDISGEIYVGGIVGYASAFSWIYTSNINNCYNIGQITATDDHGAGIAGYAVYNKVANCYSAGTYVFPEGSKCSPIVNMMKDGSRLYFLYGTEKNNFSSYITEKTSEEMQTDDFVDLLNDGSTIWEKDSKEVNFGYPILAGIDYGAFLPDEKDVLDFNVYIHRANVLHDPNTNSFKLMQSLLKEKTPSQDFQSFIEEDIIFNLSTGMWKVLEKTSEALDDITTVADSVSEPKDIYSAIILNILQDSVSIDYFKSNSDQTVETVGKFISRVNDVLKEKINLDLYEPGELYDMTEEQCELAGEYISSMFKEKYPEYQILGDIQKNASNVFKVTGEIEDIIEIYSTCILLAEENEFMKDVLKQVYLESKNTDNTALQWALLDCIDIMDTASEDLLEKILTREFATVGMDAAKYVINEFLWKGVKDVLYRVFPAVAIFQTAYKIGKLVSNDLFGTDDIIEQCVKICALVEIEELIDLAHDKLSTAYLLNEDERSAADYLESVGLVFCVREQDVKEVLKIPEIIDNTLLMKLLNKQNAKDHKEIIDKLKERQTGYKDMHDAIFLDWIYYLSIYYPNSGLFEMYYKLYQDSINEMKIKEFIAACPVDVYVYDLNDEVIAYYADGRIHCDSDVKLTISVSDDTKTVRIYDDEDYRIQYVGTDTGTMDLTVLEYEDEKVVHTVNYYDIGIKKDIVYTTEGDGLVEAGSGNIVMSDHDSWNVATPNAVSIINGTMIQNNDIFTDTYAYKGETIEINAYIPDGDEFLYWRVDKGDIKIKDIHALSTSFIMGDGEVKITAITKKTQEAAPDDTDNGPPSQNGEGGSSDGEERPSEQVSGGSTSKRGGKVNHSKGLDISAYDLPDLAETVTGTWIKDGTGWWLKKKDGTYPVDQWARINGAIYRFDRNGYMIEGWLSINSYWYYLVPGTGSLATGWIQIDGDWYYLRPDGTMATGWLFDKTYNGWFYMDPLGAMVTGWRLIDGKWYYLDPTEEGTKGIMLADRWVDSYYVDATGAWVDKIKQ